MDYLMSAFERTMRSYPYKFILTKNDDGTYSGIFKDLPVELDYRLISLKHTYNESRWSKNEKGKNKFKEQTKVIDICSPTAIDGSRSVYVHFDHEHYALKMIEIESCIKHYYFDHVSAAL